MSRPAVVVTITPSSPSLCLIGHVHGVSLQRCTADRKMKPLVSWNMNSMVVVAAAMAGIFKSRKLSRKPNPHNLRRPSYQTSSLHQLLRNWYLEKRRYRSQQQRKKKKSRLG
ncbi:hypothetical protein YC2023_045390 [Brassica napus]